MKFTIPERNYQQRCIQVLSSFPCSFAFSYHSKYENIGLFHTMSINKIIIYFNRSQKKTFLHRTWIATFGTFFCIWSANFIMAYSTHFDSPTTGIPIAYSNKQPVRSLHTRCAGRPDLFSR
jgi:hypothetical protein